MLRVSTVRIATTLAIILFFFVTGGCASGKRISIDKYVSQIKEGQTNKHELRRILGRPQHAEDPYVDGVYDKGTVIQNYMYVKSSTRSRIQWFPYLLLGPAALAGAPVVLPCFIITIPVSLAFPDEETTYDGTIILNNDVVTHVEIKKSTNDRGRIFALM